MTPIPGTTRDVLELTLDIGGLPVVVADTAGLRETDDLIEGIGVQRGVEASVFFLSILNFTYGHQCQKCGCSALRAPIS